jgi:polysaccharide biosynthesis transport protein
MVDDMRTTDNADMTTSATSSGRQSSAFYSGDVGGSSAFDETNEIDIRSLLFILWRRKWIIFALVAAFLFLAYVILTYHVKPLYSAEAYIKVEDDEENRIQDLSEFGLSMNISNTMILNEVEVLRSRSLAYEVIVKNKLLSDSGVMNSDSKNQVVVVEKEDGNDQVFKTFSVDSIDLEGGTSIQTPNVEDAQTGLAINKFLQKISVRPIPGSSVIRVGYTSQDPVETAKITNAIVNTYLEQRLARKFSATQKVLSWLDQRLATLREQVRVSESAVEQYRTEKNLVTGSRSEVTAQQLSELNSQLVVAKAQYAEAKARLMQVKDVKENNGQINAAAEVLKSNVIIDLKKQQTALLKDLSDLSQRYGPLHPKIINAKEGLRNLDRRLDEEISNIIKSISNEVEVAAARVKALEEGLTELEQERGEEGKDMIRLRELQRDAESNRLIFDTFLKTYKKSDQQEELQEPEAIVLSYATIPTAPVSPNKPLIYCLTVTLATFLGIVIILLLERFDNAFRSSGALEKTAGHPCFELIPEVKNMGRRELAEYIVNKPTSGMAEAVRNLRTVIKLRGGPKNISPKVVLMTSSFPGEGKTTLSSWLARISAKSGEKVIVVDCDLRRPNIHNAIPGRGDKTLVEYLTGQAKLEDVIVKDEATGAHVIHARSVPNSATDLIDSKRMRTLVSTLRQTYDLVIIDTPASLALSDARIMAMDSDQILYCVGWDKTPREVVLSGVKKFTDVGCKNIAFVLTAVDLQRHAKYGYGDTAYYYGKYKEYADG